MENINERLMKYNIIDKERKRYKDVPPPKNMLLEVTNCCNDSCLFCAHSKCTKTRGVISPEFAKKILKEAYLFGVREVGFYATGEPLLVKNLEEYIAYAKKIGYEYVYITTNGALMTKERAESIIESGIDSVKFSINAANREDYLLIHGKDEFDNVIDNLICFNELRQKLDKKIALYVSCVFTRYTFDSKEDLLKKIKDYVDDVIFLECYNIAGYMGKEIHNYLSVSKSAKFPHSEGNVCPLIFKNLYITYDGLLTMCCSDFQDYLVIADLKKDNLEESWNNEYAKKLRQCHLKHQTEGTLCHNCINNCDANVRALREEYATMFENSTYDKSDEIKKRIEKYLKYDRKNE